MTSYFQDGGHRVILCR